jgi:CAAX prenyl protease-like protein
MTDRAGHDWWAYLGPYGLFLILVEIGRRLPDPWAGGWLVVKVALPGALLFWFIRRGALPELRGYRPSGRELAADVSCGLAIAFLWMAPFLLFPDLPRPEASEGFDPDQLGESRRHLMLGVRLLGFAVVTPFVEELFVRSFLMRLADVVDSDMNIRRVPIARFTWRSFLVTTIWFTLTHVPWEWGVALATGVLWNLWLYRRGHIGAVIVAHSVANAAIWAVVVFGPGDLWIFL